MSLTATARSIPGTLRQEVVIDGQHRLITDQPERLGGDGSGPSPPSLPRRARRLRHRDLVQYARTKGWEPATYASPSTTTTTRPAQVRRAVEIGGDLSDAQLERLARVARACPLRRSIEAGIEFVETIERREAHLPGSWQEVHREQEADRHPRRRDGRHDDRQPAAPPLRPGRGRDPRRRPRRPPRLPAGLLFVPFGLAHVEEIVRPRRRQLRTASSSIRTRSKKWTERDEVLLDDGTVLPYDVLVSPPACACSRRRPKA